MINAMPLLHVIKLCESDSKKKKTLNIMTKFIFSK